MTEKDVVKQLKAEAHSKRALQLQQFFKTKKGEYGEGDLFYGIPVPIQRRIAKQFSALPLSEIKNLLINPYHECRMTALFILIAFFKKGSEKDKKDAVDLYLAKTKYINNWDLVDTSSYKILGPWLETRDRSILYKMVESELLWEQRIAIITTMHFIKRDDFTDCLALSKKLINHSHDLIHKAVGWMLREVGKRNRAVEDHFLKTHYKTMPRTMLRYAIEKYPEEERQHYLKGLV